MNMDDFMFLHQRNNGVSSSSSFNNGDHPQIPVIQRPQGYNHHHHQTSNWIESNQMLPIDIGLLTEESVHQMHLYLAQMQRNQIQSANWQVPQVENNHGVVLLEEECMQSLNPNPNEMKGHESFRLLNSISSPDRVSQSRESTLTTQMLGNQALNSQTRVSMPIQMLGNRAQDSQTRVSMPIQMLGNRAQDSQTRVSMPIQMQGNRAQNSQSRESMPIQLQGNQAQNSQSRESIPTQMQGNKAQNSQTRVSKPTQMQGNRAQNSQTPESIPTQMLGNRAQDSQTLMSMPTQMLGNRAQDSQTRVSMPTQMQGNRAQNSQTRVSMPTQMQGNQAQNSQTRVSKPTQMQGNQARNSQTGESKPTQIPGNRAQNSLTQASMATQMQMNQAQDSQTWESIPTQMQGNQAHNSGWTETIGLYTEILQDSSTRLLTNGVCLPQNTNSDLNNYNRDLALQNHQWQVENQAAGGQYLRVCSTPEANGSYSQLENDWRQQNCVDLNQWQQEFFSRLNQTITTCGLETNQSDGFHIPFQQPLQNMSSPSNVEYVATSSTTIGFNNAPITPEKDNRSRLNQVSATDNSYAIQRWSPEKDKQDMVVPSIKEHDGTYSNQVLTGVIASPSNSTTSIKEKVPEEGTDLNKTPQQKTPKRKKHRPKVVKEGKPKRPPKPVVSKTEVAGEKSTGKRKYVRRKGLETSTPPQNNDENEVEGSKSCRRELKFDSEPKKPEEKDKTSYLHGSKIVSNSHETTPSTELNIVSVVPAPKKDLQSINSWNLISAANQRIANEVPKRDRKAQLNSPKSDHVDLRNVEIQNASSYQENHVYSEAEQMSFLELAWATHNTEAQQLPQKGTDHVNDFQEIKEKTGQKRDYVNISGQKSSKTGSVSEISNLGVYKKTRLDESPTQSLPSVTAYAKHEHWQVFCRNMLDCSKEIEVYENINSLENVVTENQFRNDIAVENNIQQKSRSLVEEIMHRNKMMRDSFQQKTETTVKNSMIISRSDAATKSHNTVKEVTNEKALPRDYKEIACQHPTRKARGISTKHSSKHVTRKKKEKVDTNPIDEIIHRLGLLGINDEQGALVPYVGHGTLVPFEPIKKRKPRPRVNLDFETITQWNLLMGKAENEAAEKGQDKEKWWEAEREVFRGRVDKFIARMHLVQGDRRFSRWKGSVVDSVIGVFLTQNVSDHLSSSAFMSLAAQFPLRSTATTEGASFRTSISAWVEEPEVQVIDPDGTITFPWGSIRQPLHNQDSTEIGVHLVENNNGSPKDVVSSQNSSDSIILQASEDIRNGSDSEVEYQNQNRKTGKADTFTQDPIITMNPFPGVTGLIDLNVLLSEESFDPATSINPVSTISDTRATESYFSIPKVNQSMSYFNPSESEATKIQGVFPVGMSAAESITVGLTDSTKETGSSTDRYSAANQNQTLNGFNYETSTAMEAHRPNEAHSEQKTGILYPTGENIGSEGTKTSNERRKKNDTNKMKEVDWDELRKQVLREGGKKERGTDKLDSMDYEDLGNADVSKISDAIRERGMNNMLAERIKAFLNRLVKDHGSIDLEWLRDVPPDKAKDYLLSIRGLGLKSVECIRLLSLHHMAFPVDTNVGRIAVRLGWVPLQPLPESLQLHLLEMYPILESIQKYIWPRLCKLDQRTLYELHYQMITFGKVFCTKSRPNCNVCPMKGECRHFASAFASARLALPGPEEKGIVSCSNNPVVAPSEDLPIIMDPLLLAFGESSLNGGLMHFTGECEPIIEEPTTPEIYREDTESDIEDMLPQDPNEIPVIEFSLEALKANVQNIIQEQNIEISEGDLSKALVALNLATASIPAPKLKNISRLRTEHHVYELPDWHPLLEGLDRREPDDPSPYLLAIWTPGETADSIQPFENNCSLRGSGRLCDEKTCFQCNSIREAEAQMVRGTILVPCRTAMRGSFPLNGTYFQVNEVFADHESSMNPIAVPRDLLWNLRRRTVYFGTSVTSIFRGMPIEEIQYCFWRGFVCVRGFDRKFRAPRPLMARLHFTASRLAKNKKEGK